MEKIERKMADIKPYIQEAQRTLKRINDKLFQRNNQPQKTTPQHLIYKLQKIKGEEKILKEASGGGGSAYLWEV